jgi:hypothetical protein
VDSRYLDGSKNSLTTSEAVTEGHAVPVVSVTVGDNLVEFFDYDPDVLVTERGLAGQAPVLKAAEQATNAKREPGHLRELFAALRPDLPVPTVLLGLDQRSVLNARSSPPPNPSGEADPASGSGFDPGPPKPAPQSIGPGVHPQSPQGCSNGCCDPDWLPSICDHGNANGWWLGNPANDLWIWFYWNAGYSWANSGRVPWGMDGTVCSASGTSTWWWSKHSGTWSVPQATFLHTSWYCNAGVCTSTGSSSVNTQANQHLHMHCGSFSLW